LADTNEQVAVACRNALFLTDPHVDRERVISAKGTRVVGTCEWITQNESYRTWLDGDGNGTETRLLWISGGPGKGKTMLSVFLTEELERHAACVDSTELAFFFCSAQDEKRNTAAAAIRSLVYQIVSKRPQLVKHALPYFETPERTQQTLSSLEALWLIFGKLIADAEVGKMFCVLDGLDECEESTLRVLLPRIVSFFTSESSSSTKGTFRLAIVSRDMSGLRGCTTRVRLDPDNDEKVAGDIELFVSARVQDLSSLEGFNEDFGVSIQKALLKRAKGTFLWVGFAMYELSQRQTCSEIWQALESVPMGLPAVYSRMLLRIPSRQREVSRAILRWVTMAVRPLQLRELAAAVGVQAIPRITMEHAARDAVALCGPLLRLQKQEVTLVHQSVYDYLLRTEHDSDVVLEAFRLSSPSAHLELAQKCLNCIAHSDLQHAVIDLDAKVDSQVSPLLRYATLHWPEHAKKCSALAAKLFDSFELFLQTESPLRDHWWGTCYMTRGYARQPLPLLHMACVLEIIPWVKAVLAKKSWRRRYYKRVNEKDATGQTALHWAALRGNEAIVRLLLDFRADIEAKDNDGKTVLHSAASSQKPNEAVVRLLVDLGGDFKARDNDGKTVLHSAAEGGNEAVVRLLVDRGADIEATDDDKKTVLHSVASFWKPNEAVVRLLVDLGADLEAKDNNRKTVLHSAAQEGDEAVVRLLVDRGADLEAKDNDSKTVLHSAAKGGNEAVVRLLVDRGANFEAKDTYGKTVLHSVALFWEPNEAVVRLLVDLGADIEAKDKYGNTVLQSVVLHWKLNEAVMRLLVDRGADLEAKDNDGKTVLHSAALSQKPNEAVVRLLVDLGGDFKARDNDGKTVLHSAAEGGNEAAVRLLVDRGADIEAKDKYRKTVLHSAAEGGNEAAVRLLVDRGADIMAKDKYRKTVLHLAAERGNEAIVRLLVDRGADVKAKVNNGKTVNYDKV
jgi:ankyrin repeat protein